MTAFKDYCVHILGHVRPQATFLSIKEYRNNYGEIANFSVCFHASYLKTVEKTAEIVEAFVPNSDAEEEARHELLESFNWTLSGFNPLYTCNGVYEDIMDSIGKPIPGIKLHKNQNLVHINAMIIRPKIIISKALYPYVNRSEKTIAKKIIKGKTPLGKWLQFKLEPGRFDELIVQKMRIKG